MKDYLRVRAVAVLEPTPAKRKEKTVVNISDSKHPRLYEQIRAWRNLKAEEENLPHYRIISQRAVLGISNSLPGNKHQLLKVNGLGRRKLDKYGNEILEIVEEYCNKNDLAATIALPEAKTPKKNTKEITLELFKEGKTIAQIAQQRQMAESTIEGHLAHHVGTGELNIRQFIDAKTREVISGYFLENPEAGLSEAKAALDDSITFGQLKMVKSYLSNPQNLE